MSSFISLNTVNVFISKSVYDTSRNLVSLWVCYYCLWFLLIVLHVVLSHVLIIFYCAIDFSVKPRLKMHIIFL